MPEDNAQLLPTGAWALSEIVESAGTLNPPGVDYDIPDGLRFRAGVAKLIHRRRIQGADDCGLAVFLLARRPERSPTTWERTPMLDNGLTPVGGRVWIVNAPVASGLSISNDDRTDHEIFDLVTRELGLGEVPAIIVDHRIVVSEIRHYAMGLGSPDHYEAISLATVSLSIGEILGHVDRAYQEHLITPEAQTEVGKLWKVSSKKWAASNAEKVVQLYLKVYLSGTLPLCKIREEQSQITGRIDLEIEGPVTSLAGGFIRHAILELKVLRSLGETGKPYTEDYNLNWVAKGVSQAYEYRKERGARVSALCCFDLRSTDTGDDCFSHVRSFAEAKQVSLRRWFVYASSAELRLANSIQTH